MTTFLSLSTSLRVSLLISLSLTTTTYSPKPNLYLSSSSPSLSPPKATVNDILSLLGPVDQALTIDPDVAHDIWSCLRFLVPFQRRERGDESQLVNRRSMYGQRRENANENDDVLIWRPPAPVLDLARLAVDSGGDPGAIHRALDPTIIPVPDVEGCNEDKCELTRTPYGRRFINEDLNSYLVFLFDMIISRGPSVGLNVSLSRYDFFHGHLFLAKDTGRLGILFHAKEYPVYDEEVFPMNMGYCQTGSNVAYDRTMNLRNILWLAPLPSNSSKAWLAPGVLVVLDARPGGIIYRDIIPDYVQIARTIYEDDFGEVAVDVNYLNVGATSPDYQIFIC